DLERESIPARAVVSRYIGDPLLREMLFCPLMYYGSAREGDMDLEQFVTLWKAIFEQGFGRPRAGVRAIIRLLLDRYRALGGERRMKSAVRRIHHDGHRARAVELESGELLRAATIISTVGRAETEVLCGSEESAPEVKKHVGRLSFAETISFLRCPPADLGCDETIVFFNDSERFHYEHARERIDLRSGVVCCPNNYLYPDGADLPEGILRVTVQASYPLWAGLPEEEYQMEKQRWFPRIVESALRFVPGATLPAVSAETVFTDMFTPRTIRKFTSHLGGAVYGSPHKLRTGRMRLENLFLAGTDQGFLGIVGAMLSGISMANRHVLAGGNNGKEAHGG
ncbi:MAG: phytoene desaturase family protein, partial [Oceanipulchritudo sp.]